MSSSIDSLIASMDATTNFNLADAVKSFCSVDTSEDDRTTLLNRIVLNVNKDNSYGKLVKDHMGPYITNHETQVRTHATVLLAEILKRLPDLKFNASGVESMLNFFLSRFTSDYDSVEACLEAIYALLDHHEKAINVEEGDPASVHVAAIVKVVCKTYEVSAMLQGLRFKVFEVVLLLIDRPKYAAQVVKPSNSSAILPFFIEAMDGEKDPRCLVLCLRAMEKMLASFPDDIVSSNAENAFEVTSVYFPITFRPPPNDPFGITTEDLVGSLDAVFSATPHMAMHVVPMLLEKLRLTSSEVVQVKIDSLQTLAKAVPKYKAKFISPFLDSLSEALLLQMYSADETTIAEAAIVVIRAIAKELVVTSSIQLSGDEESNMDQDRGSPWHTFCFQLIEKCESNIQNLVDSMVGRASGRILAALASSSALGLRSVLRRALPLVTRWTTTVTSTPLQREASMLLLFELLSGIDTAVDFPHQCHPVRPFVESILELVTRELRAVVPDAMVIESEKGVLDPADVSVDANELSASHVLAVQCVHALVTRPPSQLLTDEQIEQQVSMLATILTSSGLPEDKALLNASLNAVIGIGESSDSCAELVASQVYPIVLQTLDASENDKELDMAFSTMRGLCRVTAVFDKAASALLERVIVVGAEDGQVVLSKPNSGRIGKRVFQLLAGAVAVEEANVEGLGRLAVKDNLALGPTLLRLLSSDIPDAADRELYSQCDKQVTVILRALTERVDEDAEKQLLGVGLDVLSSVYDVWKQQTPAAAEKLHRVLPAVASIVCALRKSVEIPNLQAVLQLFKDVALSAEATPQHVVDACCHATASVLNKMPSGAELENCVNMVVGEGAIVAMIKDESTELWKRKAAATLYVWVLKGMAMRAHKLSKTMNQEMLSLVYEVADIDLAFQIAGGFGVVVRPFDTVLNKAARARESFLFKQRFYTESFGPLTEQLQAAEDLKKPVYLSALALLVEPMPRSVVSDNLATVLPLIIRALGAEEVTTKVSALTTFSVLLKESPESVIPHLKSVLALLLGMTVYQPGVGAAVRGEVIDCIRAISTLQYHHIHPYRSLIVKGLKVPLDDRKRGVRRKAVECRNAWLTISVK